MAKGGACKPYGRLNVKLGSDDELGTFIFRTTASAPWPPTCITSRRCLATYWSVCRWSFVIDGVEFDDPFNTSCRACENNFVQSFGLALLKANNLFVRADGYEVRFSTKRLRDELLPLNDPANPCLTSSEVLLMENQLNTPVQAIRSTLPVGFTSLAVIDDPDGYTNMRSQKNAKSQIVALVVQGEEFFTYMQNGNWWQVRTAQGKVGYIHISSIRLLD